MAGMGRASSSGGKDGDGGSAGAFNDNLGLITGKKWHGTTAFGPAGGTAQGYATKAANGQFGNFRSMTGQPVSGYTTASGYPALSPKAYSKGPFPGGYTPPVTVQPLPPPPPPVVPPTVVPTAAPPPAPPPVSYAPYPDPRMAAGWMNGPNFHNSWPRPNPPTYSPASAGGGGAGLGGNMSGPSPRGGGGW